MAAVAAADTGPEARCRVFFIYGPDGSGKTFLYNCIIHSLCADSKIVFPVWTGIASILLHISFTFQTACAGDARLMQGSVCDIFAQSPEAELLYKYSLTTWDEAPMAPKEALRCVDGLLWDVTKNDHTKFGDKVLLLGGNFIQVLPLVSHRGRSDKVNACLKKFPL
ncbi:hypothetical protein PR048_015655 [Dryococelus australis]|uniref:ATP-dependent DNA helicase n=1 Tax=Dryococelus australis TaxID=614101 RepID=A0ABQ9HHI9_9NEOP|nr:hypothetical protein PR048_015655 [Dryococelus australis]